MRLNHLHFRSPRPAETLRFYQTYFGFRPHYELPGTTVLRNDERFLLAVDTQPHTVAAPEPALHFGFCLAEPEAVHHLYEVMCRDGVPFFQKLCQHNENAISFYCGDPAGNRVEVGWYRKLTQEGSL